MKAEPQENGEVLTPGLEIYGFASNAYRSEEHYHKLAAAAEDMISVAGHATHSGHADTFATTQFGAALFGVLASGRRSLSHSILSANQVPCVVLGEDGNALINFSTLNQVIGNTTAGP